MRDTFSEYYQPNAEDMAKIWQEAHFSFDTNVLLHIYRYTETTRKRLLEIIGKISDRIWLSYQAGYEFHENRLTVINSQARAYDALDETLDTEIGKLKVAIEKSYGRHTLLDSKKVNAILDEALSTVKALSDAARKIHPDYSVADTPREELIKW